MTYEECLEYLYERLPMFQRQGAAAIKKDLTNTVRLLEAMGNPHEQFQAVHIAGTNGKGTSAHALAAVLQQAGYKTGLYTSPHLKSFTERIRLNGHEIPQADVAAFVSQHRRVIEGINPSFFEVTVAMAFEFFAKQEVDIAIIETGLGGRLDSTNVITPLVSLITMIGYDHADLLGDTLEQIAAEKAGIIKQGVPVVIGADQPELLPVFSRVAEAKGAPLHGVGAYSIRGKSLVNGRRSFELSKNGEGVLKGDSDIAADYFLKNIPGIWETLQVLKAQGFVLSETDIKAGLGSIATTTGLKGRWQVLESAPAVVADVSHNEAGVSTLVQQIASTQFEQLHLILGMVRDKEIGKVMALLPANASYYFTQSSVPRSLPAADLKRLAADLNKVGEAFTNVNEALISAKKNATENDLIVVCGSTFVVAEIDHL
ncbi:bifunctional folylpolyglutamate synthase/dihydrofolate synthase [Marinoscillum furvescens]|uniref:Dihydrofolate synthase/folylpolyglutamate synthase n=1 Tax=Marinoscillum furvescens DSM 4134 TaxID=1122208 RepID=A0A3D9KYN6_MARFU|nr:folylpolyglutamate synthase/dihydrofolate synthase family protein [Marinoscillum furvescens]RED94920.1 dihydrofolate synthase/folylpolyglutamate synthase [Marinoscillum furvescens DSM 4134]